MRRETKPHDLPRPPREGCYYCFLCPCCSALSVSVLSCPPEISLRTSNKPRMRMLCFFFQINISIFIAQKIKKRYIMQDILKCV